MNNQFSTNEGTVKLKTPDCHGNTLSLEVPAVMYAKLRIHGVVEYHQGSIPVHIQHRIDYMEDDTIPPNGLCPCIESAPCINVSDRYIDKLVDVKYLNAPKNFASSVKSITFKSILGKGHNVSLSVVSKELAPLSKYIKMDAQGYVEDLKHQRSCVGTHKHNVSAALTNACRWIIRHAPENDFVNRTMEVISTYRFLSTTAPIRVIDITQK